MELMEDMISDYFNRKLNLDGCPVKLTHYVIDIIS